MNGVRSLLDTARRQRLSRQHREILANRDKLPHWRTRARRQLLAGVVLLGAAGMVAAAVAPTVFSPAMVLVYLAGFAVVVGGFCVLRVVTRQVGEANVAVLDEWERRLHHRFTRIGFSSAVTAGAITVVYLGLGTGGAPTATHAAFLLAALMLLATFSPTLAAGIALPDEEPTD